MLQFPYKTISDHNESITYVELIAYAEMFSQNISGNKYGVLCQSELSAAKAVLSVLCAGAVAVPLSNRYGENHSNAVIDCCHLSYIITDEDGTLSIKQIREEVFEKEDLTGTAVIMCTSGTTGSPKGSIITHENLIANLKDIETYFEINQNDRIFIIRPLYHCAVLTGEFMISLIKGLDIVFYDRTFDPVRILEGIRLKTITIMCATPTIFYHLCSIAKRQVQALSLKAVVVSGECMMLAVAELMRAIMPDTKIYNAYGLTEASPRVAYLPPELFDQYPLSVGKPLKSVKIKIVNGQGNDVPVNMVGELLINGPNVMRGYYQNQPATREILTDGWLYTGDLAFMDDNGLIYIKSRKDDMIIRAGMNIYPQEIENALKSETFIKDTLVLGVWDKTVGQSIHLKIIPTANGISKSQILEACKRKLPPYQMPDSIEFVETFERNGSGKTVRIN